MDIENMQKINKLARDLFQHGVVHDMEEATKQAELMVNRGDKGIADVMNIDRETGPKEVSAGRNERMDDVSADLRMLRNQVNEQARTIKGLADQLEQIKNDMGRLKGMQQPRPVMIKESAQPQTHLKTDDEKKEEPHPKVGGYDSSDVSIEKYFYSGPPKGD